MKALIFSIIALSLICPIKSTTELPVITLYIFSCLLLVSVVAASFVCLLVCLAVLISLGSGLFPTQHI